MTASVSFPVAERKYTTPQLKREKFNLTRSFGVQFMISGSKAEMAQWKSLVEESIAFPSSQEQLEGREDPGTRMHPCRSCPGHPNPARSHP